MNDAISRQRQAELDEVRRARNVMANQVAAAVLAGDTARASRLALEWKPLWDRAVELWIAMGDETGLKGRTDA